MQYGRHALDMLASSQDSLRLGWMEEMFTSAAESDRLDDDEVGLRLQSAIKLIQRVNPGAGSSKVEHRFKEIQRVREKSTGVMLNNGSHSDVRKTVKAGRNDRVTKQDFIEVFHDFCTRPEIYFMLVQFSSNKEYLDTKDLMRFLEAEQGMAHVGNNTLASKENLCLYVNFFTLVIIHTCKCTSGKYIWQNTQ